MFSRLFSFVLLALLSFALSGCLQIAKVTGPPGNSDKEYRFTSGILETYGNMIAKVSWRKGRLSRDHAAVDLLRKKLRPLDMIVVKNGHHLTDKLLPGYFSHTMIWLGSEKELRRLGLWNRQALRPFHTAIRQGKSILNVDNNGVRMLHHKVLTTSDAIVILRATAPGNNRIISQRYRSIAAGFGKEFDFNFDLDTPNQVSCTEFTARIYPQMKWTYREALGRRQLLPDDMVDHAFRSNQIAVIAYLSKSTGNSPAQLLSKKALRKKLDGEFIRYATVQRKPSCAG